MATNILVSLIAGVVYLVVFAVIVLRDVFTRDNTKIKPEPDFKPAPYVPTPPPPEITPEEFDAMLLHLMNIKRILPKTTDETFEHICATTTIDREIIVKNLQSIKENLYDFNQTMNDLTDYIDEKDTE